MSPNCDASILNTPIPMPMTIMMAMTLGFLITGLTLVINAWNVTVVDTDHFQLKIKILIT